VNWKTTLLLAAGLAVASGCSQSDKRNLTKSKIGTIIHEEWQAQPEFRVKDKSDGWGREMKVTLSEDETSFTINVVSAGADGLFYTNDDVDGKRHIYKKELAIKEARKKVANATSPVEAKAEVGPTRSEPDASPAGAKAEK